MTLPKLASPRSAAYLAVSLVTLCVAAGQSQRTQADIGSGSLDDDRPVPLSASSSSSLSDADALFLQQASRLGQVELAAARLAVAQASNPQVRAYAQTVARDQAAIERSLASLADLNGLPRAVRPDAGSALLDPRRADEGPSFDRRYASFVATGPARTVALYAQAAQGADDPGLRLFAQRTLARVEQHVALARQLNDVAADDAPRRTP